MNGKMIRFGRIFASDGRAVILPVDHGLSLGAVAGLDDPHAVLENLGHLAIDGVLVSYGLFRQLGPGFLGREAPSRILTMDAFQFTGHELATHGVVTVEQAVRQGFDAVKILLPWDVSSRERRDVVSLVSHTVRDAEKWDMPVMVEPLTLHPLNSSHQYDVLNDAVRVAYELGADILKVPYPNDGAVLEGWVRHYQVPIMLLGGSEAMSADEFLAVATNSLTLGVKGFVVGRNVWQRPPEEARLVLNSLIQTVHRIRREIDGTH